MSFPFRFPVWTHQLPARSINAVNDYLKGDAHDRSKVELQGINGAFTMATDLSEGEYPVIAGGEMGTLYVNENGPQFVRYDSETEV